ncbi:unnamed protein product, partial [Iphiclides podalirius]
MVLGPSSSNTRRTTNSGTGYNHHSGNDFGHTEAKRDGATSGQYHVLLPDGRLQSVRYSAGPSGFHADISYDRLK